MKKIVRPKSRNQKCYSLKGMAGTFSRVEAILAAANALEMTPEQIDVAKLTRWINAKASPGFFWGDDPEALINQALPTTDYFLNRDAKRMQIDFAGFYRSNPFGSHFHLLVWLQVCEMQALALGEQIIGEAMEAGDVPDHLLAYMSAWDGNPSSDQWKRETFESLQEILAEDIAGAQNLLCAGCTDEEIEIMRTAWEAVSPFEAASF